MGGAHEFCVCVKLGDVGFFCGVKGFMIQWSSVVMSQPKALPAWCKIELSALGRELGVEL